MSSVWAAAGDAAPGQQTGLIGGFLRGAGVFLVQRGKAGLLRVAGMYYHAITKAQGLSGLERYAAVAALVVVKVVLPENVRSMKTIAARVPVGGVLRVAGVIENGDAKLFAIQRPTVIHPTCALAPHVLLALRSFRACHHPGALGEIGSLAGRRGFGERLGQTDRERPFFCVLESGLLIGL